MRPFSIGPLDVNRTSWKVSLPTQFVQQDRRIVTNIHTRTYVHTHTYNSFSVMKNYTQFAQHKASASTAEFFVQFGALKCHMYSCVTGDTGFDGTCPIYKCHRDSWDTGLSHLIWCPISSGVPCLSQCRWAATHIHTHINVHTHTYIFFPFMDKYIFKVCRLEYLHTRIHTHSHTYI